MAPRKGKKRYGAPAHRGRSGAAPKAHAPLDLVVAGALALLVGLACAFRGLYFPPQQLLAAVLAAVIAGCTWWVRGRRDGTLLRTPLDWAALGVCAAYFASLFVAVHPNAAIQSWLLRCLYFLAFWSAAELACADRPRQVLLHGLLLGGAVLAVTGLIGATGALPAHQWYAGHRIYTAIQYPDAAAAYLAAMALVALGMAGAATNRWWHVGYVAVAALCLFVFLFALSRGATLVCLPVVVLFLAAHGRRAGAALAELVVALLGVGAGALPYLHGLHAHTNQVPGTVAVVLAAVLLLVVAAAADLAWQAVRQLPAARYHTVMGAAAAVLVLGGVAVGLKLHLAGSALGRLGRLSLTNYNAWSRLAWARDALKLAVQRPILGWGGGGWQAAYQSIQSYGYSSTQVHDGWVQTFVATGAVGLLLWLAFWVLLLWTGYLGWRRVAAEERPVVLGLVAACVLIGGHGLIDFTLSLGGISLTLWVAAGLLRAVAQVRPAPAPAPQAQRRSVRAPAPAPAPSRMWWGTAFGVACAALGVFALVQWGGGRAVSAGSRLGLSNPATTTLLLRATGMDPWSASARYDLALSEWTAASATSQSQATTLLQSAAAGFQRAVALDRFDPTLRDGYAQFLEATGQPAAAVVQLQSAVHDAPYQPGQYQSLGVALVSAAIAETAATSPHPSLARAFLAQIAPLTTEVAARSAAIPAIAAREMAVSGGPVPAFPPTQPGVQLAAGEAAAMEAQWSTASKILGSLLSQPSSIGGEANLWLGLVEKQQGGSGSTALLAQASKLLGSTAYQQQEAIVVKALGAAK